MKESCHLELLNSLQAIVPAGKQVVLLGDGEFDGTDLQRDATGYRFDYFYRTRVNISMVCQGDEILCGDALACIKEGQYMMFENVLFTKEKYGHVYVICSWRAGCKEPIFLVTSIDSAERACLLYRLRFRIETFFSDQKSRGFNMHESHLIDPDIISRLLIAACLAYIWIIYLGVVAKEGGWVGVIHRTERCDLSLFQLWLKFLEYVMNEGI
ncbi:MAG: transposase [Magnetococcus sp. YQC-3]